MSEFARLLEAYESSILRLPSGEVNALRDRILAAYDAARNEALEEAASAIDMQIARCVLEYDEADRTDNSDTARFWNSGESMARKIRFAIRALKLPNG